MNTIMFIVVVSIALLNTVVYHQVVNGQLTPEQLEQQSERQNNLRQKYLDYLAQHNVTLAMPDNHDVYDLLILVKQHIQECESCPSCVVFNNKV